MGMKKLFVIGGMGAGKSTARKVLAEQGVPYIDLDKVGHDVLLWDTVKDDLVEAFGADILGADGQIVRSKVAAKASPRRRRRASSTASPCRASRRRSPISSTSLSARVTRPVVVEYSVFKNRQVSMANGADVVIAVLAPLDDRIERAVAGGWDEQDVRRRIARQISDADRIEQSDVVSTTTARPSSCASRSSSGGVSTARRLTRAASR